MNMNKKPIPRSQRGIFKWISLWCWTLKMIRWNVDISIQNWVTPGCCTSSWAQTSCPLAQFPLWPCQTRRVSECVNNVCMWTAGSEMGRRNVGHVDAETQNTHTHTHTSNQFVENKQNLLHNQIMCDTNKKHRRTHTQQTSYRQCQTHILVHTQRITHKCKGSSLQWDLWLNSALQW